MYTTILDEDFGAALLLVDKTTTSSPEWLQNIAAEIHEAYESFRNDIKSNERKWSYMKYCERYAYQYYNLAVLFYKTFEKYKVSICTVKYLSEASLSKVQLVAKHTNLRKQTTNLKNKTIELCSSAKMIEKQLNDKLTSATDKASWDRIIMALGFINSVSPETIKTSEIAKGIILSKIILDIEDLLTKESDRQRKDKHELCNYLCKAYKLCNLKQLADSYESVAKMQLIKSVEELQNDDECDTKKETIKKIICTELKDSFRSLNNILEIINKNSININELEKENITKKYLKLCCSLYLETCEARLLQRISSSDSYELQKLLLNLGKVKSLKNIPKNLQNDYYTLLIDQQTLLDTSKEKELVNQLRNMCRRVIIPAAKTAQQEIDFIRFLVDYISSVECPRDVIHELQLRKLVDGTITISEIIEIVLKLGTLSTTLVNLKNAAQNLQGRSSFFVEDIMQQLIEEFIKPPEVTQKYMKDRNILQVCGKLIILSEIMSEMKRFTVEEVHIFGADVFHIDENLLASEWSGVNIVVVSKRIWVHGNITWDVSGMGQQQLFDKPAESGKTNGSNGESGAPGRPGLSGGNMFISCKLLINKSLWTLRSCGGPGGDGQQGGDGCDGKNGRGLTIREFKSFFPKMTRGVWAVSKGFMETESNVLSLCNSFKVNWKDVIREVKDEGWYGHRYMHGDTKDGGEIIFSFHEKPFSQQHESYLVHKGSPGQSGGRAGKGGMGAMGGYAGQIALNCSTENVKVESEPGKRGTDGSNGKPGKPGKNGWDTGFTFRDGILSCDLIYYGENEDQKITLDYVWTRERETDILCKYRESSNIEPHFVRLIQRHNAQHIVTNAPENVREEKSVQAEAPVHRKTISTEMINEYEQLTTNDTFADLDQCHNDYSEMLELAQSSVIEDIQEKEVETENIKTTRQQKYFFESKDFNSRYTKTDFVFVQQKQNVETVLENIKKEPHNYEHWKNLLSVRLSLQQLQEIYPSLMICKENFSKHFNTMYNLFLQKYKFATLEIFSKNMTWPKQYYKYRPKHMEYFLVKEEAKRDIVNDDLGSLASYIHDDTEEKRRNVIEYSKRFTFEQLLYPLKFFICEYSEFNEEEKKIANDALKYCDTFEEKLLQFIRCFVSTSYSKNCFANEVETRKDKFVKEHSEQVKCEKILFMFHEYLVMHGVQSACYRELLAVAFDANIQIYALDQDDELYLYHDHHPRAASRVSLYFLHQDDQYTNMNVDEDFFNLVTERHHKAMMYTEILQYVKTFLHKKQFDNILKEYISPKDFEAYSIDCNICGSYSTKTLINQIVNHFLPSDRVIVRKHLQNLSADYIVVEGKNILCTLLHRFDTEGLEISANELMHFINVILDCVANENNFIPVFNWILSTHPQCEWLGQVLLLGLENITRTSLSQQRGTKLKTILHAIKHPQVIFLLNVKIYDKSDKMSLDYIHKFLSTLSKLKSVNIYNLEKLPLSKWMYVLEEQTFSQELDELVKWDNNELLKRATHYLSCIESVNGPLLVNKFLKILKKSTKHLDSNLLLEILIYFHSQEWSLNKDSLKQMANCGNLRNLYKDWTKIKNEDDRGLAIVLNIINTNMWNSENIKKTLVNAKEILSSSYGELMSENDIKKWVAEFRARTTDERKAFLKTNFAKIFGVVLRGIELKREFRLRSVQQLAVLLLIKHDRSLLAQIATGEGKSLIIVSAVILRVLCGEKADVITSSTVLAERDATINADIYKLFGIAVSHNCSELENDRKEAYSSCPVIYGNLSSFQRDYLLDTFYERNILGDRNFENVFVDEVDSMFLDKGNNTLYLSHEIPGLDKLESVYVFIWKEINTFALTNEKRPPSVEDIKRAVLYDLNGIVSRLHFKEYLNVTMQEATVVCSWLMKYNILDERNVCLKYLDKDIVKKMPEHLSKHMDKLSFIIKSTIDRPRDICIPKFLYDFVEKNIDVWIKNGIFAFSMEEGYDYVVDRDRSVASSDLNPNIIIIDRGTGTDQNNSEWEHALHQFLQLKHGCKLSSQSLKAVFISNATFFKRYRNLFGLTGTLGSKLERDLLTELYGVDFINMPTAKPKKFLELEPLVSESYSALVIEIISKVKEMVSGGRSVLLICDTIKEVDRLHEALQRGGVHDCLVYKREHEECQIAQGKSALGPGRVIISTNLAGRGTDIKITDDLNDNGGLHVIVTYFPSNNRVEQQAFGRAARCGCNGSAQLMVASISGSVFDMRKQRDQLELERVTHIKRFYDTNIKTEEQLLNMFTNIYKSIKSSFASDEKVQIYLRRILDRWAFWLDEASNRSIEKVNMQEFQEFLNTLKSQSSNWRKWSHDPVHLTVLGLYYLGEKCYYTATEIFNMVIKREPDFCELAHYYKAAALIGQIDFEKIKKNQSDTQQLYELRNELKTAKKMFDKHSDDCNIRSAYIDTLKQSIKHSYVQIDAYKFQQEIKSKMYNVLIDSVDDILGHSVSASDFKTPEIDYYTAEKIFKDMTDEGILEKPYIRKCTEDDVKDIALDYGVCAKNMMKQVNELACKYMTGEKILRELKLKVNIPSVEKFWKILLNKKLLRNETKFVLISKDKLTQTEIKMFERDNQLKPFKVKYEGNDKKHIFLNGCNFNDNNTYVYKKQDLLKKFDKSQYKKWKQNKVLSTNKIAEFVKDENYSSNKAYFPEYDSVTAQDFIINHISKSETNKILKILTETHKENTTVLKLDNNVYRYATQFNKVKVSSDEIAVYGETIRHILTAKFCYRIAYQMIEHDLSNSKSPVTVRVPYKPHVDLMWELVNKDVISVPHVKVFGKSLEEKVEKVMENYVESYSIGQTIGNVCVGENITDEVKQYLDKKQTRTRIIKCALNTLNRAASKLKSLDVVDYTLISLREVLKDSKISVQELPTFTINGFGFILRLNEKKWTFWMKCKVWILTAIAVLEIVVGTVMLLFSAGLLAFAGSVLISEGISDMLYVVNAWKSGYFTWSQYKDHKIYSIIMSVLTSGVAAWVTGGASIASYFGKKLAQQGLYSGTKEICKMSGLALIREVGWKAVGYETGKYIFKKSCEGLATGLINVGVDHAVDNYMQKVCTEIEDKIVTDIEEALQNNTSLENTLRKIYCTLGPNEANQFVLHYTKKYFEPNVLHQTFMPVVQQLVDFASGVFQQLVRHSACSESQKEFAACAKLLSLLNKLFMLEKFLIYIVELRESTLRLLNTLNSDIQNELNRKSISSSTHYTEDEIKKFTDNMVEMWRKELSVNARAVIADNIVKPLLQMGANMAVQFVYKQSKRLYKHIRNKIHMYQFKSKKEELQKLLDADPDMSPEVRETIIKQYHEALNKIRSKVRSPSLYADMVLENGPMDMVCLEACLRALPEVMQQRQGRQMPPLHVIVRGEDGIRQEFKTPGVGETRVIELNVQDNHFTSASGTNTTSSSYDYNCMYNGLVTEMPELGELMSADDMRQITSEAIRHDPYMRHVIESGFHDLALRKRMYGGYVDKNFESQKIRESIKKGKSGLSQSSIGEFTRNKQHLSELSESMKEGFDGDPICAVRKEGGNENELIFMDNRRISVICIDKEIKVTVPVRVFDYNEVLPKEKQMQYKSKTAGEAVKNRISDNKLPHDHPIVKTGYRPNQMYIRCEKKNVEKHKEFFDKAKSEGFNLRERSNSFSHRRG